MKKHIFVFAALISLTACASRDTIEMDPYSQAAAIKGQGGVYKVGKPYKVMGQYYTPEENYNYSEVGMASWYGDDFHAKKTANNEDYNMNTLTAAHRTLPLPSIVRVTNLDNGRSLVLRVNDRGPFVKNRIIDISKHGAQLLGFQAQGTAKVRVEVLAKESQDLKAALMGDEIVAAAPTTRISKSGDGADIDRMQLVGYGSSISTSTAAKGIFVQAGSFSQKASAEELSKNLSNVGSTQIAQADVGGQKFYRVRLGPYSSESEAQKALSKVVNTGIHNAKIIQD